MFFPNPANILMLKHIVNNYWEREKIPFSLRWASYYACNIIRNVNHNFKYVGEK